MDNPDNFAGTLQVTRPGPGQQAILEELSGLTALLLRKNKAYGNSALEPAHIFASADALEQIAIRCDDKIKRIKNMGGLAAVLRSGSEDNEDTVLDLLGYLILARIAAKAAK